MDQTTTPTSQFESALTDDVLTTEEAARSLKISTQTLRAMVRAGKLTPRRFGARGRLWRFVRTELLAPPKTDASVRTVASPVDVGQPTGRGKVLQRINGALRYR